jgi:hypothetical protein
MNVRWQYLGWGCVLAVFILALQRISIDIEWCGNSGYSQSASIDPLIAYLATARQRSAGYILPPEVEQLLRSPYALSRLRQLAEEATSSPPFFSE